MTKEKQVHKEFICKNCIGERYLKKLVEREGEMEKCRCCENEAPCIGLEDLATQVAEAFDRHFDRTSDQPDFDECVMINDYGWERRGVPVINAVMEALDVDEDVASAVQQILEEKHSNYEMWKMGEETEFGSDSYYEEKSADEGDWRLRWHEFEHAIKTQTRFFDGTASQLLESVFGNIGGSIFDPGYYNILQRIGFLKTLRAIMCKPVTPYHEPLEYIPTQAIADFLANHKKLNLDGIIYPSVQSNNDSFNVVLFNKASLVDQVERPAETDIKVNIGHQDDQDSWDFNYTVWETVPDEGDQVEEQKSPNFSLEDFIEMDSREPTLQIDFNSVCVHRVKRVTVESSESLVPRHRMSRSRADSINKL